MHRLYRHFFAAFFCITLFSATGTLNGLVNFLLSDAWTRHDTASPFTTMPAVDWLLTFVIISFLTLLVLAPVASFAEYLFTRKWDLPIYWQIPAVLPLFLVYICAWSLIFGHLFLYALYAGIVALAFPMLVYWGIFRITDRDWAAS